MYLTNVTAVKHTGIVVVYLQKIEASLLEIVALCIEKLRLVLYEIRNK